MFPISTSQTGLAQAFPDVCLTPAPPAPPVPIPYPNLAQLMMALKACMQVTILNMPVLTVGSEIPMSQGDEAGVNGGTVSGQFMGKVVFRKGSAKITAGGQAVIFQTSMTAHNGANANMPSGLVCAPSQTMVMAGG